MTTLFSSIRPSDCVLDFVEAGCFQENLKGTVHCKTVPYAVVAQPLRGYYEIQCADRSAVIRTGEALLTPSNIPLRFVHHGDPARGHRMEVRWLHFRVLLHGALDMTSLLELPLQLSRNAANRFGLVIEKLLALKDGKTPSEVVKLARRQELGFAALRLVCEMAQPSHDAAVVLGEKRLVRVLRFMEENSSERLDIPRLAQLAGLSPSHFHFVFKRWTGRSPLSHFRRLRLAKVSHELISGQDPLRAIAERMGFNNEFHLSREFKALYGQSPSAYRKACVHPLA